jgi:hypothetical protein
MFEKKRFQNVSVASMFSANDNFNQKSKDTRLCVCFRVCGSQFAWAGLDEYSIDGVLLRGSTAIARAGKALEFLTTKRIPFILLTNGGGRSENDRATALTKSLGLELDPTMLVQSHTPFAGYEHLKDKCVLVVGGEGDYCRRVAKG